MAKNIIVQPIINKVQVSPNTIKVNIYTFTGPAISSTGSTTFIGLLDVPTSYTGQALKLTRVNGAETALEFFTPTYLTGNQTVTLSGDISGSGATAITSTIGVNKVTYAKIQQLAAHSLIGNSTSSIANAQSLGLGTGLSFSGATIVNSGVTTITPGDDIGVSATTGPVVVSSVGNLATLTARGNITSTGLILNQNGALSSNYSLLLKRNNDSTPIGFYIQSQNAAGNSDIFTVDVLGNVVGNSFKVTGGASSQFLKANGTVDSNTYIYSSAPLTTSRIPFVNGSEILVDDASLLYDTTNGLQITKDIKLTSAGNGIYIKEGSNATMGTGTLSGGAATISTTKVTANSRVFAFQEGGTLTNLGSIYEDKANRTVGTSFIIKSTNVLDSSDFVWFILEPA